MRKLSLLALVLSTSVFAIDYQYVSDPITGYAASGEPLAVININTEIPATMLNSIYSMLPESVPVNPAFIAPQTLSNINIDNDLETFATASVTFLNEGAGYRNSLGYFVYDTSNPPATIEDIPVHTIIFPNASKPDAGTMQQGDTVALGIQLYGGQSLGFFLVPNGWTYSGSGSTIVWDGPWDQPFYSLPHLNPETTGEKRHNVAFVDPQSEMVIYGFDDQLLPYGDRDYNDLLFTVDITPFEAIDGNLIPLVPGGGGGDTTVYYPTQNGYATIMYEDMWPERGDFDFNDIIFKYRLKQTLGNQNALKRLEGTYILQSHGAGYSNGFALHLPGVNKNNIDSVSLSKNGVAVSHTIVEAAASETILIISPNLQNDVITSCGFFRTHSSCREDINLTFELDISFITPVSASTVGQAPYDPFIFAVNYTYHGNAFFGQQPGRQWELHQKHFGGTSLFNDNYYNLVLDNSDGTNHFVDANGFPWVINIADDFDHAAEYQDLNQIFSELDDWVNSSGFSYTNWYLRNKADISKLYE